MNNALFPIDGYEVWNGKEAIGYITYDGQFSLLRTQNLLAKKGIYAKPIMEEDFEVFITAQKLIDPGIESRLRCCSVALTFEGENFSLDEEGLDCGYLGLAAIMPPIYVLDELLANLCLAEIGSPNFFLMTNSKAGRIQINPKNKIATAVNKIYVYLDFFYFDSAPIYNVNLDQYRQILLSPQHQKITYFLVEDIRDSTPTEEPPFQSQYTDEERILPFDDFLSKLGLDK